MGPDVLCWYLLAVLLDVEGDVSRAAVVLEALRGRGYGLWSQSATQRLLHVSGASWLR
jgi:hypothetical protein